MCVFVYLIFSGRPATETRSRSRKMGKRDKREKSQRNQRSVSEEYDDDPLPSSAFNVHNGSDEEVDEEQTEGGEVDGYRLRSIDNEYSKFYLYQKSVQLPKGDISYIQKFFLMYVGGRIPLHLQEDFCGTALLRYTFNNLSTSIQ